jgi:hypothetical protein
LSAWRDEKIEAEDDMKTTLKLIGAMLVFFSLHGCGGDRGASAPSITNGQVFSAGKATLAFSTTSTARLAAPISGIDFSITLPQGMTVATVNGSSGQVENASLLPGAALTGTNLAFGNYSASSRKVHLSMVTTSDAYRSGEFLRLICVVAPNTSLTLDSLKALNTPVAVAKAVGYDPVTKSTMIMTNNVRVTIEVVP